MKKIYSLLVIVFAISSTLLAQKNNNPVSFAPGSLFVPPVTTGTISTTVNPHGYISDRCGFVTQMNNMKAAGYDQAAFENFINQKIASIKASKGTAVTNYIIPVVFHVIHDGTAEGVGANVSAAQIYQQIDQLNKDFGNLSGSPFAAAANSGLSFCPVLRDPNGVVLTQPGVDRINRITKGWNDPTVYTTAQVNTMMSYINTTIKPASIWDPTQYVNIWVYNFVNSGLLGYATFPTAGLADLPAGETATTAGVVFLSGSIGSVTSPGTATPYALGRTVTHELGHFFGLYHVWGDVTTCGGTDYCADTPPCSDQYYSSNPVCTAPVQCSAQTRMIQDYMDYSDDGCMNTFTQNQVDRIQAVMAAAPRRPRNPGATICTPTIANALRFLTDINSGAETGITSTVCPKYTDYSISVAPAIQASGNATVNFTFSGTATQNIDYIVVGPTSVSYVNGESGAKGVIVRVYDDAEPETSETVIVNFTITGTGLVAGSVNQTHTLTITNDDVLNSINNTTPVATLLSEDFGTTAAGGALPTGWIKGSFGTAGLNLWTVNAVYGTATGFTAANGRALHISNGLAAAQTNETAANAYTVSSTSDAVVITKAINTTGYQNIKVTFDYASNGEADADGVYDYGLLRYSTTAQGSGLFVVNDINGVPVRLQGVTAKTTVTINLPAACANVPNLWVGFEWRNDDNLGVDPPFIIDNVVITGDNSGVETILNQSVTQVHNQGQTEQYMSAGNRIIAAITGPNMNIGCNTATIQSSGGGQTNIVTTSGTFKRSNKVIKITPTIANTTATYQVTLYYTTGELAIWSTDVSLLRILKVKDGVSLAGTLDGTNSQVFNTTVDDQRATKGYAAFTANVTGGFSQFMLASINTTIPVTLLSFEARPNGKNILLNWTTATEQNNRGFVIERSTNGTNFEKIGWVDGKMNSSVLTRYQYIDNFVQPNVLYYYRLRQTDINARETLSDIRQAKIKAFDIQVSISPNPAKDQVKLFVAGASGLTDITLINALGQKVRGWKQVNATAAPALLDVKGLAAGMYMLQVLTEGSTTVEKLIIK